MKFKVNSVALVNLLKVVSKGYDSRDDVSFIYFAVDKENNKLKIVSRSQTAYFQGDTEITQLDIEDNDQTVYYVDGEVIKRLIGIFPNAPIDISFSADNASRVFIIKYTGSKFRLPILSDNTEHEIEEPRQLGVIQETAFMDAINDLAKIVDNGPTAQEHPSSALHLMFTKDTLKAMATDRFTLAELTEDFMGEIDKEETFLIKQPQANLLSKTATPGSVLNIITADGYIGYKDNNGVISLVGLTDITPLMYQQVKDNAASDNKVTIEMASLKNALSTISKLSFSSNTVTIELDKDNNTAKLTNTTGDSVDLAIQDMDIDENTNTTFVRDIIQEALIPINTDYVRIEWGKGDAISIYNFVPTEDDKDEENVFIGVVPSA